MANKRDLKKDINFVFGDIIEAVYYWELENTQKSNKKSEAIIDDAIAAFDEARILFSPGKASNAGGVATSGLEMSQNAHRRFKTAEEIDADLKDIMVAIHTSCVEEGRDAGRINYRRGANIAGYRKVATAIAAMGAI